MNAPRTLASLRAQALLLACGTLVCGRANAGQAPCRVTSASIPATAAVFELTADTATVTLPSAAGPETVTMWGFGCPTAASGSAMTTAPISAPGPVLDVPPGVTTLTIRLTNRLPEPVSIVIPGQAMPVGSNGVLLPPVFFTDSTPPANGGPRRRVRSFTAEAPAATAQPGTQVYSWSNPRPGTYLYESGSHPGVQVQMGLYGAAVVRPSEGHAYAGVSHDKEVVLVLSEIDTDLHLAVSGGTYGDVQGATMTSPVNYHPRYFLLNGAPYAPGDALSTSTDGSPLRSNDAILVRFLNAGLLPHAMGLFAPTPDPTVPGSPPTVEAPYFTLVAEDGSPYPYPRRLLGVSLPAGKTADALFSTPGWGDFGLQDRALWIANDGAPGEGGIQTTFRISALPGSPVAYPDRYVVSGNSTLTVPAPGVLSNDLGAKTTARLVTSTRHGALVLAADGSFTYTPVADFCGSDTFTYRAVNDQASGNAATVTISVELPPVARDDSYSVNAGGKLTVPAPGLLANDSACGGGPLRVTLGSEPATGGLGVPFPQNGGFTFFAPDTVPSAPVTFTYQVSNGAETRVATVTITVLHVPPVAKDDAGSTLSNVPTTIAVLANDIAPGASLAPATVTAQAPTTAGGTTSVDAASGVVTFTPATGYVGTDTFTYTVRDTFGGTSNTATVRVDVLPIQKVGLSFSPASVPRKGRSTLVIALTNLGPTDLTDVVLEDTLPAGLAFQSTGTTQCGGMVSRSGLSTLRLTGGIVGAQFGGAPGICKIFATVAPIGSLAGTYVDTVQAGAFSWSGGRSTVPTSATFTVLDGPAVAMEFSPNRIPRESGISTLTITVSNPNAAQAISDVSFTDVLPWVNADVRLSLAPPSDAATTCGGTLTTANDPASASSITLSGGAIPARGSCTVTVSVQGINATPDGLSRQFNDKLPAGSVTATVVGGNSAEAVASLTVD